LLCKKSTAFSINQSFLFCSTQYMLTYSKDHAPVRKDRLISETKLNCLELCEFLMFFIFCLKRPHCQQRQRVLFRLVDLFKVQQACRWRWGKLLIISNMLHIRDLFSKLRNIFKKIRNETLQASRLKLTLIILINIFLITPPET